MEMLNIININVSDQFFLPLDENRNEISVGNFI